jgi:hypothetical protein
LNEKAFFDDAAAVVVGSEGISIFICCDKKGELMPMEVAREEVDALAAFADSSGVGNEAAVSRSFPPPEKCK